MVLFSRVTAAKKSKKWLHKLLFGMHREAKCHDPCPLSPLKTGLRSHKLEMEQNEESEAENTTTALYQRCDGCAQLFSGGEKSIKGGGDPRNKKWRVLYEGSPAQQKAGKDWCTFLFLLFSAILVPRNSPFVEWQLLPTQNWSWAIKANPLPTSVRPLRVTGGGFNSRSGSHWPHTQNAPVQDRERTRHGDCRGVKMFQNTLERAVFVMLKAQSDASYLSVLFDSQLRHLL